MNLYIISQGVNIDYDTYDAAVVCAESEAEARKIHPSKYVTHLKDDKWYGTRIDGEEYDTENSFPSWVTANNLHKVDVEFIGPAADHVKKGVVLSSFNAG